MPTLNKRNGKQQGRRHKPERPYNYQWAQYSKARLKIHRLCVMCLKEGITTIARATDHIIPISMGGSMWDDDNHQSLCISHHNSKTATEKRI